jgi:NAD(P)-dependent dehydrogenase (short-subunit alcohol dehydrogenase family)
MSKSVLVVGASRGLGAATVHALVGRGHRVVGAARSAEVEEVSAAAGAAALRVDVTDEDSCARAVAGAAELFGGLDAVVYNAGATTATAFTRATDADWLRLFEVNVLGAARVLRAALPLLAASPAAGVVTVGSVAALEGFRNVGPYVGAKHALLGLTRAVAAEYPAVAVDCVCPGYIATDMVTAALEAMVARGLERAEALRRLLGGQSRLLTADEVAGVIADLVSGTGAGTGGAVAVTPDERGGLDVGPVRPAVEPQERSLTCH